MMDDNTILKKLSAIDKLLSSNNPTVKDLIDQAMIASAIVEEESYEDVGTLQMMYQELIRLRNQVHELQNDQKYHQTGSYWSDSTTGWTGSSYSDPTRNYPLGYVWNAALGKVTSITGT